MELLRPPYISKVDACGTALDLAQLIIFRDLPSVSTKASHRLGRHVNAVVDHEERHRLQLLGACEYLVFGLLAWPHGMW